MSRYSKNLNRFERPADEFENESSNIRQLVDALICLSLAVIMFRTFEVEGYIISTGSMAPSLLGYHKRIHCPSCSYSFVFGTTKDAITATSKPESSETENDLQGLNPPIHPGHDGATCPNCGQKNIDITDVPRNEGDQLLVYKHAYMWKKPKRWEVIVFRNPNKQTQSYVKRVVGLPGEKLQVIDGDVYADGKIQRKNLQELRATRILVYDSEHQPRDDPTWQPRWTPDAGWIRDGNRFEFESRLSNGNFADQPLAWVEYRHWVRQGGRHKTSIPLESWPTDEKNIQLSFSHIWYDEERKQLSCRGAISKPTFDRLIAVTDNAQLQRLFKQLYEESHFGPVTDDYGYNQMNESRPVRDLMLSLKLTLNKGQGEFVIRMNDGRHPYACVFNLENNEVRLLVDENLEPVRTATLPASIHDKPVLLEMSVADRQVLAAIDGKVLFPPWTDSGQVVQSEGSESSEFAFPNFIHKVPRNPVYFAARGIDIRIEELKLFRDLHYTMTWDQNGIREPFQLGFDEYFVLGDNSPVSVDSRAWRLAAVEGRMILGKPFLVHLPSRPGHLRLGKYDCHIRIPDWSRIRYIR